MYVKTLQTTFNMQKQRYKGSDGLRRNEGANERSREKE